MLGVIAGSIKNGKLNLLCNGPFHLVVISLPMLLVAGKKSLKNTALRHLDHRWHIDHIHGDPKPDLLCPVFVFRVSSTVKASLPLPLPKASPNPTLGLEQLAVSVLVLWLSLATIQMGSALLWFAEIELFKIWSLEKNVPATADLLSPQQLCFAVVCKKL